MSQKTTRQKTMNSSQQRYALSRIDRIVQQRIGALVARHTKPCKQLPSSRKIAAIVYGNVAALPRGWTLATPIGECFDFSTISPDSVLDRVALNRDKQKLVAAADKVKDEIVLGDEEKAKKMIEAFCRGDNEKPSA